VGALESLFIDEGFSNLDNETLDIVAGALEVLGQDRRRLIGVITHVQALAERMPARIVVHKLQAGSTVSVE
jgi:exonuclease SbcC